MASRKYIPLLHILRKLPEAERQIVLSHLSPDSCDHVERCIVKVLRAGKKRIDPRTKEAITKCLREHRTDFNRLLLSKSRSVRRRSLTKVGGGPLTLLLTVGLPLLLSLLKK